MNRFMSSLGAATLVLALSLSPESFAADPGVSSQQIAAAKTPAEHEAIAAAYEQEAARLEAKAQEHDAMARSYRSAWSGSKGTNAAAMSAHCLKLATRYREAAEENRAMAAEHRKMK